MATLRSSALFILFMLFSGISACGKTGPLYLPDESKAKPVEAKPTIQSSKPSTE